MVWVPKVYTTEQDCGCNRRRCGACFNWWLGDIDLDVSEGARCPRTRADRGTGESSASREDKKSPSRRNKRPGCRSRSEAPGRGGKRYCPMERLRGEHADGSTRLGEPKHDRHLPIAGANGRLPRPRI